MSTPMTPAGGPHGQPQPQQLPGQPQPQPQPGQQLPAQAGQPPQPAVQPQPREQRVRPPKMGRPDGLAPSMREAPEDVRTGVFAWLITALLHVALALTQFAANVVDGRTLRAEALKQVAAPEAGTSGASANPGAPALPPGVSVDQFVSMLNVGMLGSMLLGVSVCVFLTFRAGRGGVYSRMFLTVVSVYTMLSTVFFMFTPAPDMMPVGFVLAMGVFQILAGVCAGVGAYFINRPGTGPWFGVPSAGEMQRYAQRLEEYRAQQRSQKRGEAKRRPGRKK